MRRDAVCNETLTELMRWICTDEHLVFTFFPFSHFRSFTLQSYNIRQAMSELYRISNGKALVMSEKKCTEFCKSISVKECADN